MVQCGHLQNIDSLGHRMTQFFYVTETIMPFRNICSLWGLSLTVLEKNEDIHTYIHYIHKYMPNLYKEIFQIFFRSFQNILSSASN